MRLRPILFCVLALAICHACSRGGGLPPNTILVNGKILTMDAHDAVIKAVAILNGHIVATGSTASIDAMAGARTLGEIVYRDPARFEVGSTP